LRPRAENPFQSRGNQGEIKGKSKGRSGGLWEKSGERWLKKEKSGVKWGIVGRRALGTNVYLGGGGS